MFTRLFEVMHCGDGDSNFTCDFKRLSRFYGKEYIDYCQAAWFANVGVLTEEEFIRINGEMPRSFFEKKVKENNPYFAEDKHG